MISSPYFIYAKTLEDFIVDANSTSNVTLNVFDYWLVEGEDNKDPSNVVNIGINKDRLLLFYRNTGSNSSNYGMWNVWNSSKAWEPVQGMVKPMLNQNGYPVLNISDDDIQKTQKLYARKNSSLEYLFNPNIEIPYRKVYTNVDGLFQHSIGKGDYYSSYHNFAEYKEESNEIVLYDSPGVNGVRSVGQFFPFNKAEDIFEINDDTLKMKQISSMDPILNHYLGLSFEAEFEQPVNGQAYNEETMKNQDMVYIFTGDDDIWIYMDDVLISDLGGIHNAITTEINFATGQVTIKPSDDSNQTSQNTQTYYIGEKYEEIASELENDYINNNIIKELDSKGNIIRYTYKDNTKHTLKIFYLERGNVDSNLEIYFWPSINGTLATDSKNGNDNIEDEVKNEIEENNPTTDITDDEEKNNNESSNEENPNTSGMLNGIIIICLLSIPIFLYLEKKNKIQKYENK